MDWQWLLGVPLFSAAALALLPFAVPTFRWSKRLSRDLQIWKDMPAGFEKEQLELSVVEQAKRIREYREYIPRLDKALTWSVVIAAIGALSSFFAFGARVEEFEWPLIAAGFITMAVTVPSAFMGRSFQGMTGAQYKAQKEAEAARIGRLARFQATRSEAKKRLRRLRKSRKSSGRS